MLPINIIFNKYYVRTVGKQILAPYAELGLTQISNHFYGINFLISWVIWKSDALYLQKQIFCNTVLSPL